MNILASTLILAVILNLIVFLIAFYKKTDKLTDITYAATFIILALFSFVGNKIDLFSELLVFVIFVWAFRLGYFLLKRVIRKGKDKRFDKIRGSFWKFGGFWFLQGLTVWIVSIPAILFLNSNVEIIKPYYYVGIIIWLIGFSIEVVSDKQKTAFLNNPENKNKWIDVGLWKYSRHPNYFGEITLWFGIYILSLSASLNLGTFAPWYSLISPLYIAITIIFISGVRILEKRSDQKWGHIDEYILYKEKTSVLIPWFNK
jgi:steroid 5-alpha reductase family enzyme